MQWGFRSRSIAICGICRMATLLAAALATSALVEPVHAQAMQLNGFNPYDPRWALATPYMPLDGAPGFNTGSSFRQQAYSTKLDSGTVGLFVASNARNDGAWAMGTSGNFFDPLPFSTTLPRQDWFGSLGNPAWKSSIVGTFKSNPNTALFDGLYTTASFGVTSFQTSPSGLPGLTNFSAGNDAVGMTASAGVGLQLTPQITVEGSFSYTQMPASALTLAPAFR